MYINSPKQSREIANEVLNFFILLSETAKKEGKRAHHLTAGHLAIMLAIPESFKDGAHLISSFSAYRVFRSYKDLNYSGTYAAFKSNLKELVRLNFLKKDGFKYSYNIHLEHQNIDSPLELQ